MLLVQNQQSPPRLCLESLNSGKLLWSAELTCLGCSDSASVWGFDFIGSTSWRWKLSAQRGNHFDETGRPTKSSKAQVFRISLKGRGILAEFISLEHTDADLISGKLVWLPLWWCKELVYPSKFCNGNSGMDM